MVKLNWLYSDIKFDIFAIEVDGQCLVKDFIEGLQATDKKKLLKLLSSTAQNGIYSNEQKFKKLYCKEMAVYEFKSHPHRILCMFDGSRKIILSHGLTKCKPTRLEREIDRAVELFQQYLQGK